jgi:predicted dehydrogenase
MTQKLRGAVIGYGFISGKGHVPAYQSRSDIEILAIADPSEGRRSLASESVPGARIYSDYRALLESEASRLDFVDISAPPAFHAEIALAALDRGLHVLCEKPLTTTLQDAEALLRKAKQVRRVLFPCHNYKHAPVVRAIREEIDRGRIGKIRSVTLSTFRNTHAKGVPEWRTHWRRDRALSGGGIAMDHGSHTFYLAFDWLGAYPTSVTARMTNLEPGRYDTEDSFNAVMAFPDGIASAHLTWTAGVRKVLYTLQGERGAITVDDDELQVALMRRTDGPDVAQGAVTWETERRSVASHWMDASHVSWFSSMLDQFRQAIDRGDHVGKEAREAYLCIQLITQAYRSAQDGCRELPLAVDLPFLSD